MKKKYYIKPEVAKNEVYTLSNLALDVVISNGTTVEGEATKQRKDESEKQDNSTDWGNIW